MLIKILILTELYFYKHSSGYFLFFPASGYRNYNDGTLRDSGKEGDGWTSTPNGSNGWYLRFLSGIAHVNSNNRGNGFPVRCVQASAPVFAFTKDTYCFFPAAGVRRYSDGVLYNGGVEGDGWTSTPVDSNNAYRFGFNSGVANMGGGTDRMYGFPVRCVQASAAVWAIQKENVKQIRHRRESGKARLCRRGQADSVTRLEGKADVNELFIFCITPSHLFRLIKVPAFKRLYFYKHSSGYFLFFPAAGLRNYSDGSLRNSGGEGDGWTSTPYNSDNAYRFILNAGNANMSNTNRTYGFPVRCVQASATVFAFTNDTFVFFPASGHRSSSDGKLYYLGSRGYVWTSVPYDSSRAYYLVFYSGGTYVESDGRIVGRSVRCVQASAPVFAFTKDTFAFFPASGYRGNGDGNLGGAGAEGDGWTSSLAGGEWVYHLRFMSGTAHVFGNYRRTGFPVRCVQASAPVFVSSLQIKWQIRFRREFGKACLCRRGQADSVTRLGRKVFASENYFVCAAPSYSISLIKLPVFGCLYFYKHSSGYFFFFPASGYRDLTGGHLRLSGSWGYGWTSAAYDGELGWDLNLSSGRSRMNYDYRGNGLAVRCVQASAAVFVLANETPGFFPAAGHRSYSDGKLYNSGTNGYGWSSTPSGGKAYNLTFWSGGANMHLNENRGHGFTVRCVQASAAVFAFIKKDIEETFDFFPASGYRDYTDGKLGGAGTWGYGWTSTQNGSAAWYLDFGSGGARVYSRSYDFGFPVRCVQASATVFVCMVLFIKNKHYGK